MEITIKGTEKEIADFVYLLQSQRILVRKPYTDNYELKPCQNENNSSKQQ